MSAPVKETSRPWTVPALLAVTIGGLGWDVASANAGTSSWISGAGLPLAIVLAVGSWNAKRWAFTVILAITLFLLVIVVPASYFLESDPPDVVPTILFLVAQLVLLMNPVTRSYATQHLNVARVPGPTVTEEAEAEPLGVRRNTIVALVFLLAAIAIAGTLGVIRIYQMGN